MVTEKDRVSIPSPDPTILTTEQLHRELGILREFLEARLEGMDKVFTERFIGVQKQFDERDARTAGAAVAGTTAVNAALQAQKEAAGAQNNSLIASITKSEAATVKQIDGILALLASNSTSLADKITTVNARLDRGDGAASGVEHKRSDVMSLVSLAIAVLAIMFTIYNSTKAASVVQVPPPTTISAPAK